MPIFEYKCKECNAIFEELVLTKAKRQDIKCINCASSNVSKLLSSFFTKSDENKREVKCGASGGCSKFKAGLCPKQNF